MTSRLPGPREPIVKPDMCPTALFLAWLRDTMALREIVEQQAAELAALEARVAALEP